MLRLLLIGWLFAEDNKGSYIQGEGANLGLSEEYETFTGMTAHCISLISTGLKRTPYLKNISSRFISLSIAIVELFLDKLSEVTVVLSINQIIRPPFITY